jgi:hypothetical protein
MAKRVPASNYNILLIDDMQAEAKLFESPLAEVVPVVTLYWVVSAKEGLEYLRQEGRFEASDQPVLSYVIPAWIAPRRSSSRNGFDKNSIAPRFIAWTEEGTSACPVRKMIGGASWASSSFCSSSPPTSGNSMSRIRQDGKSGFSDCWNSEAEPNVKTSRPADLRRFDNASRTRKSSSTTNTTAS